MLVVRRSDVGRPALARMLREGVVAPLVGGTARPLDVPDSPGLRAHVAAPVMPRATVLTGLGALWVHGCVDAAPLPWCAVGTRGHHRKDDARIAVRSGVTLRHATRIGPLALAPPPRACLDALRWEPPDLALGAVVGALRAGGVTADELSAALAHESPRGGGYRRLRSLVTAVLDTAAPGRAAPASRAGPVSRAASRR